MSVKKAVVVLKGDANVTGTIFFEQTVSESHQASVPFVLRPVFDLFRVMDPSM